MKEVDTGSRGDVGERTIRTHVEGDEFCSRAVPTGMRCMRWLEGNYQKQKQKEVERQELRVLSRFCFGQLNNDASNKKGKTEDAAGSRGKVMRIQAHCKCIHETPG